MTTPLLEFFNVNYTYHTISCETLSLKDISFKLYKNEFISFVGPSGCGKTTLLNLVAGLLPVTSGTIRFSGNSSTNAPANIGYMLQKDHLLEWRTIYKNLTLGLEIQKKCDRKHLAIIDELLKTYGLWDFRNAYPRHLSGGMRQRIALIRTMALKPDLLLLDEPFSALDYQTRLNVSKDVYDIIKSEHKTAVLVTHDISEAIALADTVILLSKSPCHVRDVIPIEFEKNEIDRNDVRNSKLFQEYFEHIWKELQSENIEP